MSISLKIIFSGCLSSSIHGTRKIGSELAINVDLFKKASYASTHHCMNSELSPFIEYLQTGKNKFKKNRPSNESPAARDSHLLHKFIGGL